MLGHHNLSSAGWEAPSVTVCGSTFPVEGDCVDINKVFEAWKNRHNHRTLVVSVPPDKIETLKAFLETIDATVLNPR